MDNQEAIEILKIERKHMTPTLFPERIEAMDMAISALREQDLQQTCNQLATDTISRQAAIAVADSSDYVGLSVEDVKKVTDEVVKGLKRLPSAQPDGIPLEWIDKHFEWLDNCDNGFAQLAKVSIKAMVEIWKKDKT